MLKSTTKKDMNALQKTTIQTGCRIVKSAKATALFIFIDAVDRLDAVESLPKGCQLILVTQKRKDEVSPNSIKEIEKLNPQILILPKISMTRMSRIKIAVMLALANTDERVRQGKPTSPGFLFATLLWHEVLSNWEIRKKNGEPPVPAMHTAMDEVLDSQGEKLAITRRIAGDIKDIWLLQPRFEKRSGRAPFRLVEQQRFRAAWDFLRLRAESGEAPQELADWWLAFQEADSASREEMLKPDTGPKKRRRRSRGRKADSAAEASDEDAVPPAPTSGVTPPVSSFDE